MSEEIFEKIFEKMTQKFFSPLRPLYELDLKFEFLMSHLFNFETLATEKNI